MNENEFMLMDRIQKIQAVNRQQNLLDNAYISFSGGKDSTTLHHLIDEALPGNEIPRIFINTGIEYTDLVKYVKELAKNDKRIIVYNSGIKIHQMLEENGYPFKSKEHAHFVMVYQHTKKINASCNWYLDRTSKKMLHCPYNLIYQFSPEFQLKISDRCCYKLKKEIAHKYQKESGKTIAITGMKKDEGGQRTSIKGCVITDKEGKAIKFHPMLVVKNEWEDWYIQERSIKLCKLYYPPYNFKRTGCKGCPFALNLQEQLDVMEKLLPAERKQCEILWKPIYEEYRRIGYRLSNCKQISFFDEEVAK